jgi:hypothetical protein
MPGAILLPIKAWLPFTAFAIIKVNKQADKFNKNTSTSPARARLLFRNSPVIEGQEWPPHLLRLLPLLTMFH